MLRIFILLLGFLMLLILMTMPDVTQGQYDDDDDDTGSDSSCLGSSLCCIFFIAMFAIQIGIGIWVYKDAESRGENGVLWLLVVFVGGLIGLIVYFIIRSGKPAGAYGQPQQFPPQPYYPPPQQPYYPPQYGQQQSPQNDYQEPYQEEYEEPPL